MKTIKNQADNYNYVELTDEEYCILMFVLGVGSMACYEKGIARDSINSLVEKIWKANYENERKKG